MNAGEISGPEKSSNSTLHFSHMPSQTGRTLGTVHNSLDREGLEDERDVLPWSWARASQFDS